MHREVYSASSREELGAQLRGSTVGFECGVHGSDTVQPSSSGFDSKIRCLTGIIRGTPSMPDDRPDDPVLFKQILLDTYEARTRDQEIKDAYETHIVDLKKQIKLLRDRIFGRKSEQAIEPNTPQLPPFNEP